MTELWQPVGDKRVSVLPTGSQRLLFSFTAFFFNQKKNYLKELQRQEGIKIKKDLFQVLVSAQEKNSNQRWIGCEPGIYLKTWKR